MTTELRPKEAAIVTEEGKGPPYVVLFMRVEEPQEEAIPVHSRAFESLGDIHRSNEVSAWIDFGRSHALVIRRRW